MTILASLKSFLVFLLLLSSCVAAIVDEREQPPLAAAADNSGKDGWEKNTIGHGASARWYGGSWNHWEDSLRTRSGEAIVGV